MAKWTPLRSAPGTAERPGLAGAHREADGVEHPPQVAAGDVGADVYARLELHALGDQLLQAAVQHVFFQLEVGDAVAQQAAYAVVFLEDHHLVAGAGQLLGRGQAGRPRADHGHPLAAAGGRADAAGPSLR